MQEDLLKYSINKKFVQEWFLRNGQENVGESVSIMANATMVPCIICAYWIGEVSDWCPEILKSIESLTRFYGYKEILNKPEGCPV